MVGFPYDDAYFDKYARYAETERGKAITNARLEFVAKYWEGQLIDVGIGCGDFVGARNARALRFGCDAATYGFDVCEKAVEWLKDQDCYLDHAIEAVCFWDSLEHMEYPRTWLLDAGYWVFVSLPIFDGPEHALRSKHLRRDEHWWYFTESGFIRYMDDVGFSLVEKNRMEEAHGREDIGTFAFHREPCQT